MPNHRATFGPAHWSPTHGADGTPVPGVWRKELLSQQPQQGDSFTLLRFAPRVGISPTADGERRVLVLDGELELGDRRPRKGTYAALTPDHTALRAGAAGALALVLAGRRLGGPAEDVLAPDHWQPNGPGQWYRPLHHADSDARVVGLSWFEPGSSTPRHPHHCAHRTLVLDGEAEDELFLPDGTRQLARHGRGDFIDYPYPIEHRTVSRTGCTVLFVHQPVGAA
ncbi:cupin domain-containing protein [Kitasatospora viridis]|uniref:ChrR-like protein with cupin domain n=1 Tax=Kitasatospora viridis TaxID=281105 RepID=A0A561UBY2_9ACTN|nr:cupin domain-containing protein [Kitasatospora viridis]TWF96878.1 ChrR-like protein with cupin domain [Kitasatospora viridis]